MEEETLLENLKEEMKEKRAEMETLLNKIQDIPSNLSKKVKEVSDFKGLKDVGEAVVEMEREVSEKRNNIQGTIQEIQDDMEKLKTLKNKANKPDVLPEVKSLLESIRDKKGDLDKSIKELEQLKDKYSSKFFKKQEP